MIPASAHFGGVLTGLGTPTIDGVRSSGEWDSAIEIPVFAGALTGSTLLAMNDGNNLYIALDVVDPTLAGNDIVAIRFDNSHNGVLDVNDDSTGLMPLNSVNDSHFSGISITQDTTIHGAVATQNDGSNNFIEYSKPLSSGDVQDFSLSFGDTVGICVTYFPDGGAATPDTQFGPNCRIGLSQNLYGDILIATPPLVGGELLPIDSTALMLAGLQTSAIWLAPVVISVVGIGLVLVKRK